MHTLGFYMLLKFFSNAHLSACVSDDVVRLLTFFDCLPCVRPSQGNPATIRDRDFYYEHTSAVRFFEEYNKRLIHFVITIITCLYAII